MARDAVDMWVETLVEEGGPVASEEEIVHYLRSRNEAVQEVTGVLEEDTLDEEQAEALWELDKIAARPA